MPFSWSMRSAAWLGASSLAIAWPVACSEDAVTDSAASASSASVGGATSSASAASVGGGNEGGASLIASCPPGEFAQAIAGGRLECTAIDALVRDVVNDDCAVYFGWRDDCNGCSDPPVKWGRVSAGDCAVGAGGDNTCGSFQLGGESVELFGLNPDGDVDGNDKLYLGRHCAEPAPESHAGPCATDELLSAVDGDANRCGDARSPILGYLRQSCFLYFGWRDNCNGCSDPPAKWGRVNDLACETAGGDSACTLADLDGEIVRLFGLNPDGDVDGNDKLHLGFHCFGATPTQGPESGACPPRQFVTGLYDDGSVHCSSLEAAIHDYVAAGCVHYFGWRDSCDGCVDPPAKWGSVSQLACQLGAGGDNTCASAELGSGTIQLLGINADGDVDGNDKLYLGTRCF
jgi:hypothetical protein